MVGWKLVSFLPSKPAPNSIWGMEHLPKFPMLLEVLVVGVHVAPAACEVAVPLLAVAVAAIPGDIVWPTSFTTGTAAKS